MGVAGYQTAIARLYSAAAGRPTAGLGLLVGSEQLVTCAHVVNTALGRNQREQEPPGESARVLVEFPLLPKAPVRFAQVVSWVPPPPSGAGGGDIAGLMLTEEAPVGTVPARFAGDVPEPGTRLRVFGYPGSPIRETGMWVDIDLKGVVGGAIIQVESRSDQTVKAQPGYSGSPVWDHGTGEAVGLLQVAPFADEPERDAYLLPPLAVAQAWEQPFDYLLVPENPYRGLEPFTAKHAPVFFGRDAEIAALSALVRERPVVVVVGPSGVGKSSLVQAGLIPALQQDQRWSVALVRPGQDPWLRLAAGLLHAQNGPETPVTLDQSQRESDRLQAEGFAPVARFLRSEDRRLLVVVDQFEELLAAGKPPDQRLVNLLLPPPDAVEDAARVVLTLRTDFLSALQSAPNIQLNERIYFLSPLTAEQTRQAVERPAQSQGVMFRPGLADEIVRDASGGALPLLEFTLTQLWATQHDHALTFEGYRAMGGIAGVLDQVAEEQVTGLPGAVADRLERVLIRLVRVPADGSGLATRQRALESDVTIEEWQVLQRLADARLTSIDTDLAGNRYAELAHESLITAWQRLRDLVTGNQDFLTWLARMEQRVKEKDPLPEGRIPEAQHWLSARPGDVPAAVSRFVENSVTAVELRMRELRDARDRAETARELAEASARRAEALRLAAEAEIAIRSARPALVIALALGTESVLTVPTMQGGLALRRVLRRYPRKLARLDHESTVNAVAFSPDGTRIATATWRSARVFDAGTGERLTQLEHEGHVTAVAFSPDGTRIATATQRSARVFDAATGAQLFQMDFPEYEDVLAVAFSPDGVRIATATSGHSAWVFDTVTGQQLARLEHGNSVVGVAFNPDGTRIATASGDCSARVFDTATWEQLVRADHEGGVNAVAFSPDGTRIATASWDCSARVFDAATGEQLARADQDMQVTAVAFSPDGTRIATAISHMMGGGWARVFDAATGERLIQLSLEGKVAGVAFSPDGALFATASGNMWGGEGLVCIFDAATGEQLARADHDNAVKAIAFSPDGARIATVSGNPVWVFSVSSRAELVRLVHESTVNAVAFSPDGTRIATGGGDRLARIFDAMTGVLLARLDHDDSVEAVAFSPDGTRLATASGDALGSSGSARVFDAASGEQLARLDHDKAVNGVAFSPDGTRLATASGDALGSSGSARVFDAASGEQLARLDHDKAVNGVAFSPDGTRLAAGCGDYSARVFNAASGEQLTRLDHDDDVNAVAFSPDGTRLATASGHPFDHRGVACVFDAVSGAELARLVHDDDVTAVAFNPDGTRLATASSSIDADDHLAHVFDMAAGAELARLEHDGHVTGVAFSPDGTRIATASTNRVAQVFEATSEMLADRALDVMARPLNPDELRRYLLRSDCMHVKEWNRREGRVEGLAEDD